MTLAIACRFVAWGVLALLSGLPAHADQSAGNPGRGQRQFLQCAACHSLQPTPGNVGPPLGGIVGRHAAATADYAYTPALVAAGLIWNEATLNRWLEHPTALVPGTKMIFAGLPNAADRLDVIAYLQTTTKTADTAARSTGK
jgi:cytochrome c